MMRKSLLITLPALIVVLFVLNLMAGAVRIPLADVVSILMGDDEVRESWRYSVLESRLPQGVTAMLCGAALAVSGLMLQTAFRNPLAGPSVFGITSGAALGVAVNCGQILMCDGGCATLYINYKRTEMRAGSMLLMKPGDIVRGEDVSDDYQVSCLAYDDSIQREASFCVESMVSDYLSRGFYTTDPFLGRFFHQVLGVVETLMKEESHEALRDVTVMLLRSFFLVCYERFVRDNADIRRKRKDELYSRFFDLLTRNYREERSVSFYADRMNMTARYLNEIANHSTGQSAKALIDDYVITQLCMALQISTKTITQITWEYNFESLSFFCDYFKRRMGITLQKFREK